MNIIKSQTILAVAVGTGAVLHAPAAYAVTNIFFNASQTMTLVSSNITALTIGSDGYLFNYSQDGYFTGGLGGGPIGRFFTVVWPNGIQAQAYTAGPLAGNGANITIRRADGNPFDLRTFTGKILLNTAAAGGAFEIMPQLNGNDAFANPLQYDCTGYAGMSFPYTPALTGYDTYLVHMWGDFALTQLTLADAGLPPELKVSITTSNYVRLNWPTNSVGYSLQNNSILNSTNWNDMPDVVGTSGTNYQVMAHKTNGASFFRLIMH